MEAQERLSLFAREWDEAMVRNDVEEIAGFMSEDWVIVGTEGGITSKSAFLEWIRSGDLAHSRMDSDEMSFKFYDNTGVVISRGTSAGKYKGEPFEFYEWSTCVYIWMEGNWQCVLTMLTPALRE